MVILRLQFGSIHLTTDCRLPERDVIHWWTESSIIYLEKQRI